MAYKALTDLSNDAKNAIISYRIQIDGTAGACFVWGSAAEHLWLTELDCVVQTPDIRDDDERTRKSYLVDFLKNISFRPLDNLGDMEKYANRADTALNVLIERIEENVLDPDMLDGVRWTLHLRDGYVVTVIITPVLRTGGTCNVIIQAE